MKSGISTRIGKEWKDLITECTAQEFKDWMKSMDLPIPWMRDTTLDGIREGKPVEFFKWEIRIAFINDLEAKGTAIYRVKPEWDEFYKAYTEEHKKMLG